MLKKHTHAPLEHVKEGILALAVGIIVCGIQAETQGSLGAHFLQKHQPTSSVRPVRTVRTRVLRRVVLASAAKNWALKDLEEPHVVTRMAIAIPSSSKRAQSSASSHRRIAMIPSASLSSPQETIATEPLRPAAPAVEDETFPAFGHTVFPVPRTPDWGSMRTPLEWNRRYDELARAELLPVPSYNLSTLTIPLETLKERINEAGSIAAITAKLFYSTRFFGAYDLDSGEFTFTHPGIDLKLAEGTPVAAVAGGRVHLTKNDPDGLGLHVIIEHRIKNETFYSIYGHFESISISEGETITPGQTIGLAGATGFATAPHLHLQVDRGEPDEAAHTVYWPSSVPSRAEAERSTVHPIEFITRYRNGAE